MIAGEVAGQGRRHSDAGREVAAQDVERPTQREKLRPAERLPRWRITEPLYAASEFAGSELGYGDLPRPGINPLLRAGGGAGGRGDRWDERGKLRQKPGRGGTGVGQPVNSLGRGGRVS